MELTPPDAVTLGKSLGPVLSHPMQGVRRPGSDMGNWLATLEMPNRAPTLSPPPRQSRGLEAGF